MFLVAYNDYFLCYLYFFFFELPVIFALESCSYWDAMMYFEAKIESGIFLPLLHTKGLPTFVKR
jgi:hypothetical protein